MKPMNRARHLGITAVAIFAIIVGIGEMIVGFTGNFLGILSTPLMPPSSTIIIGLLYILGGLSFLTMRKRGAALGMIFVAAELLGRVHFVATGISPDGVFGRRFSAEAVLRFRLMVIRGPCKRPQASGEAQHEVLCRFGRFRQRNLDLYCR